MNTRVRFFYRLDGKSFSLDRQLLHSIFMMSCRNGTHGRCHYSYDEQVDFRQQCSKQQQCDCYTRNSPAYPVPRSIHFDSTIQVSQDKSVLFCVLREILQVQMFTFLGAHGDADLFVLEQKSPSEVAADGARQFLVHGQDRDLICFLS